MNIIILYFIRWIYRVSIDKQNKFSLVEIWLKSEFKLKKNLRKHTPADLLA